MHSMPRTLGFLGPLSLAALLLGGCGEDHHTLYTDGGTYNCELEDRDDTFLAGMAKSGTNGVTVTLVSSTPTPPARGDNTFVLAIEHATTPATGAAVEVVPFMPDHRHGSPIPAVVSPGAGPGEYQVTPVNLWMPGLWEITVKTVPAGGTQDLVAFRFCIPG